MIPLRRLLLAVALVAAAGAATAGPTIAIILDDLGHDPVNARRAVELPGAVTLSFLPRAPYSNALARAADARGKEVMLHQPMQPIGTARPGPGAVMLDTTERGFRRTLRANLAAVPGVAGVNNHMGSLITRHPGHMDWLMTLIAERGDLYFVDSRTTPRTVAERIGLEHDVPVAARDVFLDNRATPAAIERRFAELVQRARETGFALAIGHPYPETLAVLERELDRLPALGVKLVPVSRYIALRKGREVSPWSVSSFHSPTAARSSKPSP